MGIHIIFFLFLHENTQNTSNKYPQNVQMEKLLLWSFDKY